ncbi:Ferredoxin [Sinorhizobium sojae CCBAU 05684]|uniref:Ferredoxin n=1 Tax=Sinorhizobium sojae CCBAU 05684 TaxID=716928 RepID=A0A249P8Q0_9HYPH|nr:four-helix bundle copper-binding protein [Sinorhizobium sojae]ASY62246.1 Ferredoxin [Sinorhizobium sojae CCBAU 05684]
MNRIDPKVQECIDRCLACYSACLSTAMGHCLETGGKHTEPAHFRLMMACAEICRTAAHFMLVGTRHHRHVCAECAEICAECATDCERIGEMQDCVEACRRCAESCRLMAA